MTLETSKYNPAGVGKCIIYAIIFLYVVIMISLTPLQLDDLFFMRLYLDNSEGYEGISFNALWKFVEYMRDNDNTRIGNLLAPIFAIVAPFKQIFPFLTGFCVCGIVYLISYWSDRNKTPIYILLIWTIMILFLPWRDQIFCQDFALNYIFSSFITLYNVYLITRFEKRGWSGMSFCYTIFITILAGGWHEGFAFPTIGGLLICMVLHRFKMSWYWYGVVAIYLVSALIFGLSPGIIDRAGRKFIIIDNYIYLRLFINLVLPIMLYLVTLYLILINRNRKEYLKRFLLNDIVIVFFFASMLSFTLNVLFDYSSRTAFYPNLCSIIVIFVMINWKHERFVKSVNLLVASVCTVILLIQGWSSIMWQYKLYQENKIVMKGLAASKTGTFFYDRILPSDIPIYTLFFPSRSVWETRAQIKYLKIFLKDDLAAVVPTSLKNANINDGKDIGNGFYMYEGKIITNNNMLNNECDKVIYFDVELTDGIKLSKRDGYITRFTNDHSQILYYCQLPKIDSSKIKSITLVK